MSRYGHLVCHDCAIAVWLGKTVFADDGRPRLFHVGAADAPPNSRNQDLTRVVWKLLAEHAGHHIAVVVDGAPDSARIDDYRNIGGDTHGDISFEDYLAEFSG